MCLLHGSFSLVFCCRDDSDCARPILVWYSTQSTEISPKVLAFQYLSLCQTAPYARTSSALGGGLEESKTCSGLAQHR
eukprot:1733383-Amphidinium_carterae.1